MNSSKSVGYSILDNRLIPLVEIIKSLGKMSIYYRMDSQTDNLNDDKNKKRGLYPRVIRKKTVNLKELANNVSDGTTFNPFEVEIALKMALDTIVKELKEGNNVCLDGFGTFSLSAESHTVKNASEIRAESIHVKRVIFKTSQILMRELKNAKFERMPQRK